MCVLEFQKTQKNVIRVCAEIPENTEKRDSCVCIGSQKQMACKLLAQLSELARDDNNAQRGVALLAEAIEATSLAGGGINSTVR